MGDMVMILFLCGRHNLELEPHVHKVVIVRALRQLRAYNCAQAKQTP